MTSWGTALMGRASATAGRFPLLVKLLDATQALSIQVHPDESALRAQGLTEPAKHEAWYVIHAEPGAVIYRGLAAGVTLDDLRRCMVHSSEKIIQLLRTEPAKAGNAYYLPSGTVHALGEGVVVAEVQTSSDVTYRLYDWGRKRPSADAGLHVEAALASVREAVDPSPHEKRSHVTSIFTTVTRLIDCPSFRVEKVRFVEGVEQDIPYAEPVCWIVLEGEGEVLYGSGGREHFRRGDVMLLPAALKDARLKTKARCTWLEVTMPTTSDLSDFQRPDASALRAPHTDGLVQLNVAPRAEPRGL
jgi:mannose-6-phosphate isomerase